MAGKKKLLTDSSEIQSGQDEGQDLYEALADRAKESTPSAIKKGSPSSSIKNSSKGKLIEGMLSDESPESPVAKTESYGKNLDSNAKAAMMATPAALKRDQEGSLQVKKAEDDSVDNLISEIVNKDSEVVTTQEAPFERVLIDDSSLIRTKVTPAPIMSFQNGEPIAIEKKAPVTLSEAEKGFSTATKIVFWSICAVLVLTILGFPSLIAGLIDKIPFGDSPVLQKVKLFLIKIPNVFHKNKSNGLVKTVSETGKTLPPTKISDVYVLFYLNRDKIWIDKTKVKIVDYDANFGFYIEVAGYGEMVLRRIVKTVDDSLYYFIKTKERYTNVEYLATINDLSVS